MSAARPVIKTSGVIAGAISAGGSSRIGHRRRSTGERAGPSLRPSVRRPPLGAPTDPRVCSSATLRSNDPLVTDTTVCRPLPAAADSHLRRLVTRSRCPGLPAAVGQPPRRCRQCRVVRTEAGAATRPAALHLPVAGGRDIAAAEFLHESLAAGSSCISICEMHFCASAGKWQRISSNYSGHSSDLRTARWTAADGKKLTATRPRRHRDAPGRRGAADRPPVSIQSGPTAAAYHLPSGRWEPFPDNHAPRCEFLGSHAAAERTVAFRHLPPEMAISASVVMLSVARLYGRVPRRSRAQLVERRASPEQLRDPCECVSPERPGGEGVRMCPVIFSSGVPTTVREDPAGVWPTLQEADIR